MLSQPAQPSAPGFCFSLRRPARRWLALLAGCAWLLALPARATDAPPGRAPLPQATAEIGLPFIHNFDPAEYGGATQNWALTQGTDGVIYVGNVADGILSFDGAHWSRIAIPNSFPVRALVTAPNGRIYVGIVGGFGYLAPDANGRMAFVSLTDQVPKDDRDFSDIWSISLAGKDVFFASRARIFRLHEGTVSVIKPQTFFHVSFAVNGTFYVREVGRGLMRWNGSALELVPDGARFADERIYVMLPWHSPHAQPGTILVGSRTEGWFLYDGQTFQAWSTEADAALKQAAIYNASWLADGRLAVGTLRGGLFLLDTEGHWLRQLTRADGLSNNAVYAQFQDRAHGLWLATDDGVTHVDIAAPVTQFKQLRNLEGIILNLTRHDGDLYVGTTEGVYRLVPKAHGKAHLQRLPAVPGQSWSFASVGDQFLVAGNEGVFALRPDGSFRAVPTRSDTHDVAAQPLLRSRIDPTRVFVGYQDGLGSVRWRNGHWLDEGRIAEAQVQADNMVEGSDGRVWMGLYTGGVAILDLPPDWQGPRDPRPLKLDQFHADAGLPDGKQGAVLIDGRVRFATRAGIYLFDADTRRFQPDPAFAQLFPDGVREISSVYQDRHGDLWMYTTNTRLGIKETGRAHRVGGQWRWSATPLQPIAGIGTNAFVGDADGVMWMGGDKGLYRYDPNRHLAEPHYAALVRKVASLDGQLQLSARAGGPVPEVPWADNALRFEFAVPSPGFFGATRYQVFLEGVDRGWSSWSDNSFRDYTNLHEGTYRFRVRARNVYDELSREASFEFNVTPPWYRSWWAWSLWLFGAAAVLLSIIRWRSQALRRRNRILAKLVERRTTELAEANLALLDSNSALDASNKALAEQSVTDPLTGLKNRRYLYDHIEQDLALSRRKGEEFERGHVDTADHTHILFLMADIDHFKQINDTWGHAAGDRVLQQLRDILLSVIRESDIPVRWGGEEFLIVARFAPADAGPESAERIRAAVAAHRFDIGEGRHVQRTCSIGFASYPASSSNPDALDWEQVVNLADECLYAAKHHGRDAWAGVLPMAGLPLHVTVIDSLRNTLAGLPQQGAVPVAASWVKATDLLGMPSTGNTSA